MGVNHGKKKEIITSLKRKNNILYLFAIIGLCALIGILWISAMSAGSKALRAKYVETYEEERTAAYQSLFQKFFDRAEKEYHVKNRVSISVGDMQEVANLEVLNVSDIEYIIVDADSNEHNITAWLAVPGEGTYVINLQAAEFIVDEERTHVLVRAPYPEMTNITIIYRDVEKLLFKNDMFNESYRVGEDLAKRQLDSADLLIKKEFASNQLFYISAQEAGKSIIECMVKQFNPEIPDLDVEVEYY